MHSQEREQALAKTAVALMGDCNVLPTPDNFELFYIYAAGENTALSQIIGDMISQRRPFTPKVLGELRARVVTQERAVKAMEDGFQAWEDKGYPVQKSRPISK